MVQEDKMRKLTSIILMFVLFLTAVGPEVAAASPASSTIPVFYIDSVVRNSSVTITTYNFPAHDHFDVLMGYMHTKGVNGYFVTNVSSGAGGTLTFSFAIPSQLYGQHQISIRLQSSTGTGYFAYNWFYNNSTGTSGGGSGGYTGIPTFSITSVVRNKTVTITTNNFPKNDKFDVLMGLMHTKGINGYYVTNVSSGAGGTLTFTFNIPSQLAGSYQISIRLQSSTGSGYYAYNWFYNNTYP
jgi:hypothetical protein